jgi:hypothetical protein
MQLRVFHCALDCVVVVLLPWEGNGLSGAEVLARLFVRALASPPTGDAGKHPQPLHVADTRCDTARVAGQTRALLPEAFRDAASLRPPRHHHLQGADADLDLYQLAPVGKGPRH